MGYFAQYVMLLNFVLVCILPFLFFRRDGKYTLMWLLTALPYVLGPVIVIAQWQGYIKPSIAFSDQILFAFLHLSVGMNCLSIFLIAYTMGTHRIPVALWHQRSSDDAPQAIVTWGAYARIRHPFYTSYLVLLLALVLMSWHWSSILLFIANYLLLNYTARKEEYRLSHEQDGLGETYRHYMRHTGRFVPRLRVG